MIIPSVGSGMAAYYLLLIEKHSFKIKKETQAQNPYREILISLQMFANV
jgi:hypothetical protein